MKQRKLMKSITGLLLAIIMIIASVSESGLCIKTMAAENITLRFHYNGSGGICDSMKMYIWRTDGGTLSNQWSNFSKTDDYGKVATYSVPASLKKVGYLVTTSDWRKDYASDRILDFSDVSSGYVDVYVTSGEADVKVYKSSSSATPWVPVSACISGESAIDAVFTSIDTTKLSQIVVKDYSQDGYPAVEVSNISYIGSRSKIRITFKNKLNFSHTYKVCRIYNNKNYGEVDAKLDFNSALFKNGYTYTGNDLGSTYSKNSTTFKVWAPTAKQVEVLLFESGSSKNILKSYKMSGGTINEKGVWSLTVSGDLKNKYYLYRVNVNGSTNLAMDPYAKAGDTTNDNPSVSNLYSGQRSMVVDLNSTNPTNWSNDGYVVPKNATDAIIYETSVRDFSSDTDSGISSAHRMKYLAFTEHGTKNSKGSTTGIDYLKKLGITHVQIMPSYDFSGTNEKTMANYNWGYNPVNYNIPEGAFSTKPEDGNVRVKEYKEMVKSLHNEKIGVIMDVVYNHVNNSSTFSFEKIVPGYFFRPGSNGSGCGNDVASERVMVSKYIVDSVTYWAKEYHIDGFRFDLVGLLDIETMNAIRASLNKINPKIMMYGEGWDMGTGLTRKVDMATQWNVGKMPGVGVFNDRIRNAVGGNGASKGFASGSPYNVGDVKNYIKSMVDYTHNPLQNINYLSCHDNYTLWDKISKANASATIPARKQMNKLAAAINLTSQGIPLFLSGEEFLRTKNGDENSYKSPDSVNMMDWSKIDDNKDVVDYYKGLIAFRKAHAGLRMTTSSEIRSKLFYRDTGSSVIAYTIHGSAKDEIADNIFIAFNPYSYSKTVKLPTGTWKICVNGEKAGTKSLGTASGNITLTPYSAYILVQGATGSSNTKSIKSAKISGFKKTVTYTGKAITQKKLVVKYGSKTLVKGKDYKLVYSKNKALGTAKVTIKGIGKYSGSVTKSYKIVLGKTNSLSVSAGRKKASLKWKKVTGASGYQIYMATGKKSRYSKVATVKKGTTLKYTVKKLNKNKSYYFKVRAYKKVGKKTYYGSWSTVKGTKVK